MRRIRFALVLVAVLLTGAGVATAGDAPRPSIAIIDFQVTAKLQAREPELSASLSSLVLASLSDRWSAADREDVLGGLEELELAPEELFDSTDKAMRAGRKLGVDCLVLGRVSSFGDRIAIAMRILDVAKGRYMAGHAEGCESIEELPEIVISIVEGLPLPMPHREKTSPPAPKRDAPPPPERNQSSASLKDLLENLDDSDAGVRFAAAVELGKRKMRDAAGPLIGVLEGDRDIFVRRAAARSLGELRATVAVPALIDAMLDPEFFVGITAHKALVAITGRDFGFAEGMTRDELEKMAEAARAWWEENRPK